MFFRTLKTETSLSLKRPAILAALALASIPAVGWAQKNSGDLIPVTPPPSAAAPVYRAPPAPVVARVAPPAPAGQGHNPVVEAQAQALPLDPATRELTNREPADIHGVERRLNLRETHGQRTDLRGHTPSTREIVDALAPR